jgi:hypothetical protein
MCSCRCTRITRCAGPGQFFITPCIAICYHFATMMTGGGQPGRPLSASDAERARGGDLGQAAGGGAAQVATAGSAVTRILEDRVRRHCSPCRAYTVSFSHPGGPGASCSRRGPAVPFPGPSDFRKNALTLLAYHIHGLDRLAGPRVGDPSSVSVAQRLVIAGISLPTSGSRHDSALRVPQLI